MNKQIKKRIVDESWDYNSVNTKEFTHCYHNYPAMMIPQVARRLIEEYSTKDTKLLFDPFCGTGTSLVEAKIKGINAIGTDLNPLARLIANAKTISFNETDIERIISLLSDKLFESNFVTLPEQENKQFNNIDFGFSAQIINQLSYLSILIESIPADLRTFFLVCLSETIRESSYTRNSEFKLFRMNEAMRNKFKINAYELFLKKCSRNFQGLKNFNHIANGSSVEICAFNSSNEIPANIIDESIDIIVTSPPYGDSSTTVAYGQFSRLSSEWLGFDEARQVDNMLMGGKRRDETTVESDNAKPLIEKIGNIDTKRAKDVNTFLLDYKKSITNIVPKLKKGGYACYVVGNRTVKGVNIPLDAITGEFFEACNMLHVKTIVRNIPNKRMPKKNSPTNIVGATASTMNHEYIVICKKD